MLLAAKTVAMSVNYFVQKKNENPIKNEKLSQTESLIFFAVQQTSF